MKYTIVGCITKYNVQDIKPYVESIKQSGFKGDKIMLVYDVSG
jgi:tetrahydromethanopterin S-methyltransferase subunit F